MLDRKLNICAFCDRPTWCYDSAKGPMCGGCRVVFFFRKILYRPLGFDLLAWQEAVLRGIFGPADIETGERLVQRAYIEVPKKNGKSFLIGGLPIYNLLMEGVVNPETYGCAAAKEQAGLVYKAAARLVNANPMLRTKLKVLPSTKRIIRRDHGGFYAVLSADGDLQDGIEPSLAVVDELHRWKTARARTLHDVLLAGTISRENPLVVQITSAGDVYESEICWEAHEQARLHLEGTVPQPRFYAAIYSANEERIKTDAHYWETRECRAEANPSHEDHGGFLRDAAIAGMLADLGESSYQRYHLGLWGQKVNRWTPMDAWKKCGVPLRQLVDRECWLGVDLSKTTDLCALLAVFPDPDGTIDVQPWFWLPEDRIPAIERRTHMDIQRWVRMGLITATPGNVVDYGSIRNQIDFCRETFHVQELCYDPWNATDFIQRLIDDGLRCVEIRQGGKTLSAPMKFLMEKILNHQIRHGGHEVLTWNADCLTVKTDTLGNICPAKDKLGREGKRIDGMAALVTALARIIAARPVQSEWASQKVVI